MKCSYSPTPYQWHDGNQHHVGVMVHNEEFAITRFGILNRDYLAASVSVLMAHSHTRELEFVKYGLLKPYPSEPIPEPSK
jgi:hypothetical protein